MHSASGSSYAASAASSADSCSARAVSAVVAERLGVVLLRGANGKVSGEGTGVAARAETGRNREGGIRIRLGAHLGLAELLERSLELDDGRAESLGVLRGRGVEQTSGDVAQDGVQGLPGRGLMVLRMCRERTLGKPQGMDKGGGRRLGDGRGGGLDVRHRARACD